jgi:CheY-like chemotaxis protein
MQMPKMDGLEATEKIFTYFNSTKLNPPIILAMTANVLEEAKKRMPGGWNARVYYKTCISK